MNCTQVGSTCAKTTKLQEQPPGSSGEGPGEDGNWATIQGALAPIPVLDAEQYFALIGSDKDPYIISLQDAFKDSGASSGGTFQRFTEGVIFREKEQRASAQEDPYNAVLKGRRNSAPSSKGAREVCVCLCVLAGADRLSCSFFSICSFFVPFQSANGTL